MTEPLPVVVARIEQRLIAVERDIRDMKAARPPWTAIVAALAALAALVVNLMT